MLFTRDEARGAFARSACTVATEVTVSRWGLAHLLTRRGAIAGLTSRERRLVATHWVLADRLLELGFDDVIEAELEGILGVVNEPTVELTVLTAFVDADHVHDATLDEVGSEAA